MASSAEQSRFRPPEESKVATYFRATLGELFVAQASATITMRDYNPFNKDKVTEKFLGGHIPLHYPNHFARVAIRSWSYSDEGNENVSISVDSDQYLISNTAMVEADSQSQPLGDTDILVLQGWLGPGRAVWSKGESRLLANKQLAVYSILDRGEQSDYKLT